MILITPVCANGLLVGLVVVAYAARAEDPGFEPRLRRDFSGVESTDLHFVFLVSKRPSTRQSILQERMYFEDPTRNHTKTKIADQTCSLIQLHSADTRTANPSMDSLTPGHPQSRYKFANS